MKENTEPHSLAELFSGKLREWEGTKGQESLYALGEALRRWSNCIPFGGRLFSALEPQILSRARSKGITPEAFIEELFAAEDADAFLATLLS